MRPQDVTPEIVGRRVSCIENGCRVTGTVIGISEDKYTINVRIRFDKPLHCWSGDYNIEEWDEQEYDSWARKFDGWGNLQHTYFIDTLDWLKDYKPKDEHFTNEFEVKEITDSLGLENMTNEELQEKRNDVVRFYHDLKLNESDPDKRWDYSTAMMSVTAVIDSHKWNRGMEI